MLMQTRRNTKVISRLTSTLTSEISKKLQRNPLDQINDGIEKRHLLPERRQHLHRIERAAEDVSGVMMMSGMI